MKFLFSFSSCLLFLLLLSAWFGSLVVAFANPASDSIEIELAIAIVRHGIGSEGAMGDAGAGASGVLRGTV